MAVRRGLLKSRLNALTALKSRLKGVLMVELTTDEALMILKKLSLIEGFLLSVSGADSVFDEIDIPVKLLSEKLRGLDVKQG